MGRQSNRRPKRKRRISSDADTPRWSSTRTAGRREAPQPSYDKRRHRNCFQTRPLQAFPKKVSLSWGQRSVDAITGLHRPQKKHSPRSEFTPELHRWISKSTTRHLQINSPSGDLLITLVKETEIIIKRVSKKWKKSEPCSNLSFIW